MSATGMEEARITLAKRKEQEYLSCQRENNLFFDENTNEEPVKFREKLKKKEENYDLLFENIRDAVRRHNSGKNPAENEYAYENRNPPGYRTDMYNLKTKKQ